MNKKSSLRSAAIIILLSLSTTMTATSSPAQLHLANLTQAERQEFTKTLQQSLQDPAVQSTRRITRMALHKAMLQADPSIDTIFANMNAHAPKNAMGIPSNKKSSGINFQEWLANYPSESTASLTATDIKKLHAAHQKALQDSTVQAARKTARITFYNAMINADPAISPILTKAGISTPKSVVAPIKNSNIGSEEKILGGNFDAWDTDILVPAVEKMKKN